MGWPLASKSDCVTLPSARPHDFRDFQVFTFRFCPCAEVLTRLRLLITSVLRLIGRAVPCSLRNSPQALQRTEPSSSRRHRGVVEVPQFWHTGCRLPRSWLAKDAIVDSDQGGRAIRVGMCADKGNWCQDLAGQLQLTGTLPCPPLVAAGDAVAYIMLGPMLLYAL